MPIKIQILSFIPKRRISNPHLKEDQQRKQRINLLIIEASSFRKISAFIFATISEKLSYFLDRKFVSLIDRPEHGEPLPCILVTTKLDALHHPIEHFAVIHLHHVLITLYAERFHR